MTRTILSALAVTLASLPVAVLAAEPAGATPATATPAAATPPAEAKKQKYSVETTTIGDMLDNADLKAILVKHLPVVANSDQIDMARGMTLRDIQPYDEEDVTNEALAKIEAELKLLG